MTTFEKVWAGLNIMANYNAPELSVSHDEIHVGTSAEEMHAEDVTRMEALGWRRNAEGYWSHFV